MFGDAALAVLVRDVVAEPVGHPHALAARSAAQVRDRLRDVRVVPDDQVEHPGVGQLLVDRDLLGGRLRRYSTQQWTLAITRSAPAARAAVACATIAGTSMRFTDHGLSASTGMPLVP